MNRFLVSAVLALVGCSAGGEIGPRWQPFDAGGFFPVDAGFPCGAGGGFAGGGPGQDGTSAPITPSRQPPPISGGTLAVLADGTIVAADSDRDEAWVVPPAATSATRVELSVGDEPGRVVEGPAGRAFIALRGAGSVAEIDVAAHTVVARHPACGAPRGLAWQSASSTLVVACATGELARLQFANGALTSNTKAFIVDDLRDVVVDGSSLLVSTFRTPKVLRIDPQNGAQTVAFNLDTGGNRGHAGWRLVQTARGPVLLHQQQTEAPIGQACVGYGGSGIPAVVAAIANVTPGGNNSLLSGRLTVVVDVAPSPDGRLALAAAGSSMVGVVPGDGIGFEPVWEVGQPVAVAYRGTTLVVQSREPAELHLIGPSSRERIALSNVSRRSTGHDLFHYATNAAIACASCHPEAGDDGHIWTLPEGKRRTPTLRGGLAATAPFHWDGAFAGMGDLVSEIMVRRMGGAPQTTERTAALLAWMDSVPKLPAPPVDAASAARGEALFNGAAGCAACHSGPQGTNNQSVSVGTGEILQVPRLVELAGRAPYFHDGRVPTLAQRFEPVGGTAHGNLQGLDASARADLVEYMRTR